MKLRNLVASAAIILFSLALPRIAPAAQPVTAQSIAVPANPAAVPAARLGESWWAARHQTILDSAASHADAEVVFIGDSTFNNYDLAKPPAEDFQSIWKQFYAPRRALNLGFSGDTTANVLWRIDHGELDGLNPRAVVLLVGSANTDLDNQTALQTSNGIDAVVGDITRHLPVARVVVLGILPSGLSAEKTAREQEVNTRLESLFAGDRRVLYLDMDAIFYNNGGSLNRDLFCDKTIQGKPLLPNALGQLRLAEAIEPALANLLGDSRRIFAASPEPVVQQASAR